MGDLFKTSGNLLAVVRDAGHKHKVMRRGDSSLIFTFNNMLAGAWRVAWPRGGEGLRCRIISVDPAGVGRSSTVKKHGVGLAANGRLN
jgi:hypothetical protein